MGWERDPKRLLVHDLLTVFKAGAIFGGNNNFYKNIDYWTFYLSKIDLFKSDILTYIYSFLFVSGLLDLSLIQEGPSKK